MRNQLNRNAKVNNLRSEIQCIDSVWYWMRACHYTAPLMCSFFYGYSCLQTTLNGLCFLSFFSSLFICYSFLTQTKKTSPTKSHKLNGEQYQKHRNSFIVFWTCITNTLLKWYTKFRSSSFIHRFYMVEAVASAAISRYGFKRECISTQ